MSFVVYDRRSTLLLHKKNRDYNYASRAAAAAAITRYRKNAIAEAKKGIKPQFNPTDLCIIAANKFFKFIEKKEVRQGIVHADGKEFTVGVNTLWTAGPWSETYWCS